jgi:CHAT domain-containing protein
MAAFSRVWRVSFFFLFSISLQAQVVDTAVVVREVDSLIQVARRLATKGSIDNALEVNAVAENIAVSNLGTNSVAYGNCCQNRGVIYAYNGDYNASEKSLQEARAILRTALGKEHPSCAAVLQNLAIINNYQGHYVDAESFYLEAKSIYKNAFGETHSDYAKTLNSLAILYREIGRYVDSESLFLEAKPIFIKTFGKEHIEYAYILNNIAVLYVTMGRYTEAEPFYLESKSIRERTVGKNHLNYAQALNNLANLYYFTGRYTEAEPLYLESKSIRENVLGKENPNYALSLNSLGLLYSAMGRYTEAEPLYLESKSIREKTIGKEHPDYANTLTNLAGLYRSMSLYNEAESLFLESKSIREKVLGKEHPDYAENLQGLANLYASMDKYAEAERLYLESKSIREKVLGKEHPDYGASLSNLTSLYLEMGRYAEAEPLIDSTTQAVHKLLTSAVRFSSEKNLEDYLAQENPKLANIPSCLLSGQFSGHLNQIAYDNLLFQKGFLQNAARRLNVLTAATLEADSLYKLLKSYRFLLSKEYAKPIAERRNMAEMEEKANALESQLARSVAGFAQALQQVKWNEVQATLQPGEAAVEFLHFPVLFPKKSDSTMYAALIIRPGDSKPEFVAMFEEKQLTALLEKTGDQAQATTNLYAATRSGDLLGQAPAYGTELYKLIWKPLDSLLQAHQIKKVYFSPSGLLHRVAFAALPIDGKKVLADRYELHQLGSTRSLVVKTPEPLAQEYTAAIFGGVQYDRSGTQTDSTAPEITDNRLWTLIERPRSGVEDGFDYLPGTAKEAQILEKTLAQNRIVTRSHTGAQATEEALKALGRDTVKSPDILHIATHGFFFPDPEKRKEQRFGEENAFKWNENPLFRSGLALAGANTTWSGQPSPGNIEDGIATAYEISHLNLSNTKLVVLSACETGLGDIKGSEGVYGLQRAFKMAGADFLLVSLWQVPDKETVEFMDFFYGAWLKGKTIHEAFAKAQKKMRKKYKEVYKWGAWVLVE